jgi:acyl-CoA thioesterase-1
MARVAAIEKGKEVEKMKRHFAAHILFAATLLSLCVLRASEAKDEKMVIVAFGDSLTAGLGLSERESFPAQLEAALKAQGKDVNVVNAGVSGDTTSAALQRLDWALPQDASAVIVELGGNDALQGIPPDATKANLAKIIEAIKAKGLPVLLAGMESPRNMGKDYVDTFHTIYPALAAQYGVLLYPFFLDGVALDDSLMQGDGIHPNAKGVAKIVASIMPKVDELLSQGKAKSN